MSYSLRSLLLLTLLFGACSEEGGPPVTPDDGEEPGGEQEQEQEQEPDAGRARDATVATKDASVRDARPIEEEPREDASTPVVDAATLDARTPTITDAQVAPPSDAEASTPADLGKGDGKDVIAIGDSWMNLGTSGIQQSLKRTSGQPYRTYGVAGVQLLSDNLFGAAIPSQYARAKREDPDIKTVVMTGGGNDILMGIGGANATIDRVAVRLGELWAEMHEDGVEDVVYIGYSRGGSNEQNVIYGNSKVMPVCAAAALRCHFLDSDEVIMEMLRADGIHPTNAGYDALGKAVFTLMEREGLRR